MNLKAKPHLEQSMQEEQKRKALNTHWHASAVGDANAEHDIYDDAAICDYPQSGERILGRRQFTGLAKSSSRQAVWLQRQADSRKRESLDHGIHNRIPGATGIHGEYYGVPQRQGRARNTVFRGSLRGTGLAEAVGSADRARQTLTIITCYPFDFVPRAPTSHHLERSYHAGTFKY
jgi:hypothetical protein